VEKRVKRIFDNLKDKPDAILIKNSVAPFIDDNFFYITGLQKGIFEGSIAVLHPDGGIDLLVSELEAESASKVKADLHVYKDMQEFKGLLNKYLFSFNKIGLSFEGISYKGFCKLKEICSKSKFIDVSEVFARVRLVKDEIEIKLIKKSCAIADKVMQKVPDLLHQGMYEYELAAEIDYLMQKNGADKPAFETISSFGRNTAEPHYSHGNTRLKKDDFALFDFGACLSKYNSDITRTIVFGKASAKQKEMYKTVLEAQKIGFKKIKPGIKASMVHKAVNGFIDKTSFKGCFIHSTGHALGLAVHDRGAGFSVDSDIKLQQNMVFTVEPGVYIPGFGGVRIEDDILVKKDGIELLTKTPRELIEV
jgi:Xaa-Pro dipeptidase